MVNWETESFSVTWLCTVIHVYRLITKIVYHTSLVNSRLHLFYDKHIHRRTKSFEILLVWSFWPVNSGLIRVIVSWLISIFYKYSHLICNKIYLSTKENLADNIFNSNFYKNIYFYSDLFHNQSRILGNFYSTITFFHVN